MRHWDATSDDVGNVINEFSIAFAQPITVLSVTFISCLLFAGFPYDNLCESKENNSVESVPMGIYRWGDEQDEYFVIDENSSFYSYCDQGK